LLRFEELIVCGRAKSAEMEVGGRDRVRVLKFLSLKLGVERVGVRWVGTRIWRKE
jgi:hypothetical protein